MNVLPELLCAKAGSVNEANQLYVWITQCSDRNQDRAPLLHRITTHHQHSESYST